MYEKVNPCHHHQFRINGPFIDFNELPSVMIIGETKSVVTEPIFQTITVEKGYQERNGVCVIPLKQSPARRQRTCVDRRMRNRKKEMSKLNEKSESPYVSRPNSPSIDLNRDENDNSKSNDDFDELPPPIVQIFNSPTVKQSQTNHSPPTFQRKRQLPSPICEEEKKEVEDRLKLRKIEEADKQANDDRAILDMLHQYFENQFEETTEIEVKLPVYAPGLLSETYEINIEQDIVPYYIQEQQY